MRRILVPLLVVCTVMLCGFGCTRKVHITSSFPSPVVETLPLQVGLYYSNALRSYVHAEKKLDGSSWVINLGDGHEQLFEQIFAAVFVHVTRVPELTSFEGTVPALDLIVEPRLDAYTFQTQFDIGIPYHETRLRYTLNLYSGTGTLLHSRAVEGHGRYRTRGSGTSDALRKATIMAMRDAAAHIVLIITDDDDVKQVLHAQSARTTPHMVYGGP